MAETYTKLFGSIVASTVWQEPAGTRLTWITMLAMADKNGVVEASIPGLANIANVTVEECERAINAFLAPDRWSRTPDHEGRRIEAIYGGWRLLNHGLYRAKADSEERAEYKREWDRKNRKKSSDSESDNPTPNPTTSDNIRPEPTKLTQAEADTASEEHQEHVHQAAPAARERMPKGAKGTAEEFNRVWAVYPVKKGKADAERHWRTQRLDPMADEIIAHIRKMEAEDEQWRNGFIPHGSTYFCGKRWEDEPTGPTSDAKPNAKPPPPESFGPAAAMKPSETPLERDLAYARQRFDRGEFESEADYRATVKRIQADYGPKP